MGMTSWWGPQVLEEVFVMLEAVVLKLGACTWGVLTESQRLCPTGSGMGQHQI